MADDFYLPEPEEAFADNRRAPSNWSHTVAVAPEREVPAAPYHLTPGIDRWQALHDQVKAERDPLALFLLTPLSDLEQQVELISYFLWKYLAYEAELAGKIIDLKEALYKHQRSEMLRLIEQQDPGTGKLYTQALATKIAETSVESVTTQSTINALIKKQLRVKAYCEALRDKSEKLPGTQGTYNRWIQMEGNRQ